MVGERSASAGLQFVLSFVVVLVLDLLVFGSPLASAVVLAVPIASVSLSGDTCSGPLVTKDRVDLEGFHARSADVSASAAMSRNTSAVTG